jgi:hypothetical protein
MKPKGRIRQHADGRWGYYRRAFGFGKPTRRTFKTWAEAMAFAIKRLESSSGVFDFGSQDSDGLASFPRWSPLRTGQPEEDSRRRPGR